MDIADQTWMLSTPTMDRRLGDVHFDGFCAEREEGIEFFGGVLEDLETFFGEGAVEEVGSESDNHAHPAPRVAHSSMEALQEVAAHRFVLDKRKYLFKLVYYKHKLDAFVARQYSLD